MTVGIINNITGITIELNFLISRVWSDKYLAKAIIVNTLANSLGCKVKGKPILSQRYVPACNLPKNGRVTRIIPIKNKG